MFNYWPFEMACSYCAVLGAFDVVLVAVSFQQGVVGDDILRARAFRSHDSTPYEHTSPLRTDLGQIQMPCDES